MTEKKETDLTLEESFLKLDRLVEKLESRETSWRSLPGVPAGNGTVKILQREDRPGGEKDAADQRRW